MNSFNIPSQAFPIDGLWCVHSYYSLCPYAPDGSGRLLVSGADLNTRKAWVLILSADGKVLNRFGGVDASPSFWHTGLWQSWSPDARFVYFQSGTLAEPYTTRHEIATGKEVRTAGDLEGIPPSGEPGLSCLHGLLYAAGYGDGQWKPDDAPVPFLKRDQHGIFELNFDPPSEKVILSTQQILDLHPHRDRILQAEEELKQRLGPDEGLTLMTYCIRWNRQGTRFLFYFGNHCVVKERGEPKLSYVLTANRDLSDIHLALDLSFGRPGVHWSWQPDGEHLIGYGPYPDGRPGTCIAGVRYDGSDYQLLADHTTGSAARHPSVSPADYDLIVTDEITESGGAVVFFSRSLNREIKRVALPKYLGDNEPPGRNPDRVCHHPVFNHDGSRILCNTLPSDTCNSTLVEISVKDLFNNSQS